MIDSAQPSSTELEQSMDVPASASWHKLSPMEQSLLTLMCWGWVTPLLALEKANCLSLSQRVGSLARAGYPIEKDWFKTDTGKTVRRYRIKA